MATTTTTTTPIHVRARPGDYAPACLLPGDPLRAKYISERFLEAPRQTNAERGLLGYTGTFRGREVSVQATGMGAPSAAIVLEELIRLGVTRVVRVGTCGAMQPGMALGDLVVAVSSVGADGATQRYTAGEPHAPTADWALTTALARAAGAMAGRAVHVGPVASSDVFYDPDAARAARWASRGVLAVEMEAAVVFTLGAMRRVAAGCVLAVSDAGDAASGAAFVRIGDAALREAVDAMVEAALVAAMG